MLGKCCFISWMFARQAIRSQLFCKPFCLVFRTISHTFVQYMTWINLSFSYLTYSSLVGPLCPPSCGNGKCQRKTGNCLCNQGWTGKYCSLCGGKIRYDLRYLQIIGFLHTMVIFCNESLLFRLNSTEGWLADAIGNYTVDTKCTWLIEAPEYLISGE